MASQSENLQANQDFVSLHSSKVENRVKFIQEAEELGPEIFDQILLEEDETVVLTFLQKVQLQDGKLRKETQPSSVSERCEKLLKTWHSQNHEKIVKILVELLQKDSTTPNFYNFFTHKKMKKADKTFSDPVAVLDKISQNFEIYPVSVVMEVLKSLDIPALEILEKIVASKNFDHEDFSKLVAKMSENLVFASDILKMSSVICKVKSDSTEDTYKNFAKIVLKKSGASDSNLVQAVEAKILALFHQKLSENEEITLSKSEKFEFLMILQFLLDKSSNLEQIVKFLAHKKAFKKTADRVKFLEICKNLENSPEFLNETSVQEEIKIGAYANLLKHEDQADQLIDYFISSNQFLNNLATKSLDLNFNAKFNQKLYILLTAEANSGNYELLDKILKFLKFDQLEE